MKSYRMTVTEPVTPGGKATYTAAVCEERPLQKADASDSDFEWGPRAGNGRAALALSILTDAMPGQFGFERMYLDFQRDVIDAHDGDFEISHADVLAWAAKWRRGS